MNATLSKLLKPSVLVPVLTGVGAAAGGFAVGYFLGKKERKVVFIPNESELAKIQADVDEMQANRLAREEAAKKSSKPEITVEEHIKRKLEHVGEPTEDVPGVVARNVFAEEDWGEWNYAEEIKNRDSSEPYIIHEEEFYANELGYEQVSYLYYAGDDTVVDVEMQPKYERHLLLGDNLKFGKGSRNKNTVYIRNEQMRVEFEVTKDPGAYTEDVQGLTPDEGFRHMAPPRFRPEE